MDGDCATGWLAETV